MRGKIISISLILCLVAPIVATFSWFHFQKKQIRREVKHQLMAKTDKSNLVLLAFLKEDIESQLRWKHSKEFEFRDHFYDIVESRSTADSTYYWCWPDNKETQLNKNLDDVVNNVLGNNPERTKRNLRYKQFYQTLYFANNSANYTNPTSSQIGIRPYVNLYKTITPSVASPPPQTTS